MSNLVRLETLLPVLETVLENGGEITFTPRGNSMRPMLKSGVDVITLKRFNRPLKKYALPLYRRESGQFVLHRVVGKNKDGYIMRGDNQLNKEYGITDANILGEVIAFTHNGREYKVTDFSYKLYCVLWCNFFTIFLRRVKQKLIKILKGSRG